MKIIDIGTVIDNKDPKGIGRIRYISYDTTISAQQSIYKGPEWDKKDPFVALPFLPFHINIIPEKNSAVKIIKHIAEKDGLVNQEYIPGPFTTPHDFKSQTFSDQLTYTSYGVASIPKEDIKNFSNASKSSEDNYVDKNSVGTISRIGDVAFNGNYGADLLLTENGAQLRAGKFVTKETKSQSIQKKLKTFPYRGKKEAKLLLKKFPYTAILEKEKTSTSAISVSDLSHILEYDIDSFSSPTEVILNLYKIKAPDGDKYKTNTFNYETNQISGNTTLVYTTTYNVDSIEEASALVTDFISNVDCQKLNIISTELTDEYAHPFYFRPVVEPDSLLKRETNTITEIDNKKAFLEGIEISNRKNHGLLFSKDDPEPPITAIDKIKEVVKNKDLVTDSDGKVLSEEYNEQAIGALISDKFYLLSSETNGIKEKYVDFSKLSKYELDQNDYLGKIEPNTFATVRGEKLIEILDLMIDMLLNHVHGMITEPKWPQELKDKIRELKNAMNDDMVNKSIRIN